MAPPLWLVAPESASSSRMTVSPPRVGWSGLVLLTVKRLMRLCGLGAAVEV